MDTIRQTVVSPVDLGGKNVFIINDVDLEIPPTQIEIRKEDLTFHYRTLRTKSSTKVPTGNGQVTIHATIVFTDDQLLTMHRLIVEMRNSPFCYVDNRYIRESIVPDWPYSQNMALTVTGLSVSNMPNATNAYVMELDMLWFNYFPYMHNFLFREEWQTNWLRSGDFANKLYESLSIGWDIDNQTYVKQPYPNVIYTQERHDGAVASTPLGSLDRTAQLGMTSEAYSITQNKFLHDQKRTIYEMEAASAGVEWDLLPVPGNMMPARLVTQPRNSKIYVRFINYLQRDALLKNFGIDVEADIKAFDGPDSSALFDSLFKVGVDPDGIERVIPLSSGLVPRSLRHKWIKQMEQYNHGARFHFHAYKEIRLPQKWTDDIDNKKNQVVANLFERIKGIRDLPLIMQGSGEGDPASIPVMGAAYRLSSPYGMRNRPTTGERHFHSGVDFAAPRSTPLYAVEEGDVVGVIRGAYSEVGGNQVVLRTRRGTWYYLHMDIIAAGLEGTPDKPVHVTQGQVLGTVGTTGRLRDGTPSSTGPHLHLTYYPTGSAQHADPYPVLQEIHRQRTQTEAVGEETFFDWTGVSEEAEPEEVVTTDTTLVDPTNLAEILTASAAAEAKSALNLTEDESTALQDLMGLLDAEGWSYYDADTTITNVWKKLFTLEISHSGLDRVLGRSELPEEFRQAGIILTGITGGISHLVAKIPILSHEFPTQQHLGSIEPEYTLEFAILDDQSDLDGISSMGQMVQGMRSMLQGNARKFRAVMDGWCVSTDTFITRLFGSYEENDLMQLEEDGLISDLKLKKRTIIASTYDGTVPGNPGLSTMMMSMQETNPYEQEKLVSTASTLQDKEQSRRAVLQALMTLGFNPKYKDMIVPFLLARKLNTNLTNANSDDFGKFHLAYDDPFAMNSVNLLSTAPFLFRETARTDPPVLLLRESNPSSVNFLRALGIEADYYKPDQLGTGYIKLSQDGLDDLLYYSTEKGTGANGVIPADAGKYVQASSDAMRKLNVYDLSTAARENPELANIPLDKFMDTYATVDATLRTGWRMFAEQELGGFSKDKISEDLYGLDVRTDMWKGWQMYLEEFVKMANDSSPAAALESLHQNPAWPFSASGSVTANKNQYVPDRPTGKGWEDPIPESERYFFTQIAQSGFGPYGQKLAGIIDTEPVSNFTSRAFGIAAAGFSSTSNYADVRENLQDTAISRLTGRYMSYFPIQVYLTDALKQKYQYILGDLLGNAFDSGKGRVYALDSIQVALEQNAKSCGNISDWHTGLKSISSNPMWMTGPQAETVRGGFIGTLASEAPIAREVQLLGQAIASAYGADPNAQGPAAVEYVYQAQEVGNPANSPFAYPVEQGVEDVKVRYIKGILAALADEILSDYRLLDLLNLGHLMYLDQNRDYSGLESYPDLQLPAHPYYGTNMSTYPDFYMWNIYEDGGALGPQDLEEIYSKVYHVVENCYNSMARMSAGEKYDERTDLVINESAVDDPMVLNTEITPEGTDAQKDGSGPSDSVFYPSEAAKEATKRWQELAGKDTKIGGTRPADYIEGIRLSNAEGLYGAGAGVHYPSRVGPGAYAELKKQLTDTTQLFGSSEGYLNQQLDKQNMPEIAGSIEGTNLERPAEAAHTFDLKSLQQLAKDSAKDLISQKMSMKRAYPTLKLYFIEEDEFETRIVNFDDFYSYNAIKEAQVVQSRKIAADHAVLTVQNISGSLDGTRRNTVVDLDYFSSDADRKLDSMGNQEASRMASDPVTTNTAQDQPFGSVVLRPGLNVQLRMGFSNDPNNLHVMLSGRVVDVTWNKTGDLAEIMIQSFGTELAQAIKGTARNEQTRTFYTTHELLGSMMLEPEVTHFGRWEFGQQFFTGEAKDHRLDFTEYSREGKLGTFRVTKWLSSWIMNHPWLTMGVAIGATAVSLFPFGGAIRAITGGGKATWTAAAGTAVTSRIGALGTEGALGYKAMNVALLAGRGVELAEDVGATVVGSGNVNALIRNANLLARAKQVIKPGVKELDELVALRYAKYLGEVTAKSGVTLGEVAAAQAKFESFLVTTAFKSRWMAKPWLEISSSNFWTAFGRKPVTRLVGYFIAAPLGVTATAFGSAAAIDLIIETAGKWVYDKTIGTAQKFFARSKASLFLTPQDDNLYPPHPKDYMNLDKTWAEAGLEYGLHVASMVLTNTTDIADLAETAYRYFRPNEFISKKVSPDAVQYQIVNSSIWDIFHEMSIRHPGWIYGTRPYGNDFRYTMFFGLPSQRYWARPASNAFVTRANDLRKFLDNRADEFNDGNGFLVNEFEFRSLYGEKAFEELQDYYVKSYSEDSFLSAEDPNQLVSTESESEIPPGMRAQMSAIAIKEYLRAVQLRFEPFRRYHLLTSERDIVWNGIMGSEAAVSNAVDISYMATADHRADDFSATVNTAVFKAHAFIPENKLRIAPVRWYNCKGYPMAMRYAMGELLDRMKDMYRGELLVLGNPRIRPWDIGILIDSYNDMVGPIEVEQVVHIISHETGYLTEIKPSAVTFANEISGWPMVEAMKLFSMAVHDIHNRYTGVKADNGVAESDPKKATGFGSLETISNMFANPLPDSMTNPHSAKYDSFMDEKYKKIFGEDGASLSDMWGADPPPDFEVVDNFISDLYENSAAVSNGVGRMGMAIALTGSVVTAAGGISAVKQSLGQIGAGIDLAGTGPVLKGASTSLARLFVKNPIALAGGVGIIGGTALAVLGFGAPVAMNYIDFPSIAFLLGSNILFLQCLRNDAIIVVPLVKSGNPIIAGLAYNDPGMIWTTFRGQINRMADDTISGVGDMVDLYKRYGSEVWRHVTDPNFSASSNDSLNLTGG